MIREFPLAVSNYKGVGLGNLSSHPVAYSRNSQMIVIIDDHPEIIENISLEPSKLPKQNRK